MKLLQVHELHMGRTYFFVPHAEKNPVQGLGQGEFPKEGMLRELTPYLYGCCRRGSILPYEPPAPVEESHDD